MNLSTPVVDAGLSFRLKRAALERLGITTLEDLLFHLPFRYEDFTNTQDIRALKIGEQSVIHGTVVDIMNEYTKRRFVLQKATISDDTGTVTCTWFNQTYLTRVIHPGDTIGLVGKLEFFGRQRSFQVKDFEVMTNGSGLHTTGFVPVYNETRGISSKWIRSRIHEMLMTSTNLISEFLPKEELLRLKFGNLYDSLLACHFPKTLEEAANARQRLAFDELLLAQLAALKRREEWEAKNKGIPFEIKKHERKIMSFIDSLPFKLTDGQNEAISDLQKDLQKEIPMNRLLEGDVGSGKTVVATIAMYISYLNGYQSVIMAPTEILALQHYESISRILKPLGIEIALFTGSKKTHKDTPFDIAIGTHALIQEKLNFEKLGLVVIDEQQRFGVEQRALLREKAKNPHFLTMTATPIPRTILLAIYKDLDVSLLKELPNGRKHIKTWLVPPVKRTNAYAWVKKQIVDSNFSDQAFIVCPFIEESESMDTVKAAKSEFERLQKEDLKGLKLGLLHGKLKAKEKNEILEKFREKKIHVLVATPVVEVGIDIPDATIMIIEAADRFGLSQLHQLRGRVGRGDKQSYCLLFTESNSEIVTKRLKFMETSHSGFELAELDLKLRGPGDMFGTKQHGSAGFKIADFGNFELVSKAKKEAENLLPHLFKNHLLSEKVENVSLKLIHPD
jgi:ATP-dependent DNA helicase RecG